MLKAIIFDLDDTLLKTKQTKFEALKFAGKHFYNLELTDETLLKHWGKPFMQFMGDAFEHVDSPENLAHNYKSIVKNYQNQPYENTVPTLEILSHQYKMGILSATAKSIVLYDMEQAGLPMNKFTYIQTEDDTNVHKPNPKVFAPMIRVMAEYEIVPADMLYIGDHPTDFQASTGAGLQFIGMAERTISAAEFATMGARSIDSIVQLPSVLAEKFAHE